MAMLAQTMHYYVIMLMATLGWFSWRMVKSSRESTKAQRQEKQNNAKHNYCKKGQPCIHSQGKTRKHK